MCEVVPQINSLDNFASRVRVAHSAVVCGTRKWMISKLWLEGISLVYIVCATSKRPLGAMLYTIDFITHLTRQENCRVLPKKIEIKSQISHRNTKVPNN